MGLAAALVAAGGVAGAATIGGAATTALPVDNVSTTVPSDTLSPTLTLTDCTVPPSGDGTSIVALSDSSEMSGSSAFTVSPALTNSSITGMSLKSPMSGTRTSATPPAVLVGDGGAETAAFGAAVGAAACAAAPESSSRITLPSLTLSPSLILSSFTVPAAGAGTSIVALSDSSETSGSSDFTESPTFTMISMIGTSLKSPMSGTFTSAIAPMSPSFDKPFVFLAWPFTPSRDRV